jgi:hypothetical protein
MPVRSSHSGRSLPKNHQFSALVTHSFQEIVEIHVFAHAQNQIFWGVSAFPKNTHSWRWEELKVLSCQGVTSTFITVLRFARKLLAERVGF